MCHSFYRGIVPAGGWPAGLALMKRTFEQGEGLEYVKNGKTGVAVRFRCIKSTVLFA